MYIQLTKYATVTNYVQYDEEGKLLRIAIGECTLEGEDIDDILEAFKRGDKEYAVSYMWHDEIEMTLTITPELLERVLIDAEPWPTSN